MASLPPVNDQSSAATVRSESPVEDSLNRQPGEVVPYKILPQVVDSVKQVVASRVKLFSSPGKTR
jgi:hypothetical protein